MAEKGRGYAISPLKVNFAKVYLLRLLTPLRGVQKSKRPLHGASGQSPLLVCTKIHPVKNFRTAKIFSSLPTFANKNFSVFNEKISAKRSAPQHARKRAKSVSRYWPMSPPTEIFRTAKNLWSADCQLPQAQKRGESPFSNNKNGWLDSKSMI